MGLLSPLTDRPPPPSGTYAEFTDPNGHHGSNDNFDNISKRKGMTAVKRVAQTLTRFTAYILMQPPI